jgi:hypothetical protein
MTQTAQERELKANEDRRTARREDAKRVEADLQKQRDDMIKMNLEKMQREAEYRPTPTPDEIREAMAGKNKDYKEPDGSPEQNPAHPVANAAQQIEVGREIPPAQSAAIEENSKAKTADKPATTDTAKSSAKK